MPATWPHDCDNRGYADDRRGLQEAGVIYQVLKDPNLKFNELIKLQEALARMGSVIERNNREPWDKHDCA